MVEVTRSTWNKPAHPLAVEDQLVTAQTSVSVIWSVGGGTQGYGRRWCYVSVCCLCPCRNYMNDSLRTNVFVRFQAETIACACIYLAARALQVRLDWIWLLLFISPSLRLSPTSSNL